MIGEVIVPIVVIVALVALNGVFVAAEFALVAARPSRLRPLDADGNRAARWLLALFERHAGKDSYIAVAQLGITLASIGLGMYGEPAVAHWLYGPFENAGLTEAAAHSVGFIIALSAITYLHVVFGEMIPKALALQAPESVSIKVNPLMRSFGAAFRPVVSLLNTIAFALMRLLRIPEPDKRLSLHTSAELAIVADEAAEGGQLGLLQRDLIRSIFDLDDRTAEEIMVTRSNIAAIELAATPEAVEATITASARSRYPVIDGDLDHVVGMLHIKDFIRAQQRGESPDLAALIRPLPTVAATTSAEDLLEQFKHGNAHAALVIDEYGGTLGFVALDDVIAEVMEHDPPDTVTTNADGSITIDGETTLAELRSEHHLDLDHPDVVTVAGVVLAASGTVPPEGTRVSYGSYDLIVEATEGHRITSVRISARPADDGGTHESA
ncbi:MAG: hemolysin family protein [Acidimicrobiales bacterium]